MTALAFQLPNWLRDVFGQGRAVFPQRSPRKLHRKASSSFSSIFENAQIGISLFKIDGQEPIPNRALHEMLGYTEKELSHLEKWDEITHPDAPGTERYAELVQGKREKDEWEQRWLVRRDGRIVVTNARYSLIRDAAGKPQYVASCDPCLNFEARPG